MFKFKHCYYHTEASIKNKIGKNIFFTKGIFLNRGQYLDHLQKMRISPQQRFCGNLNLHLSRKKEPVP